MADPNQRPEPAQDSAAVFISYAREDRAFATRLDESMRLKGVAVRGDWQLGKGEDYEEQLRTFILDSDNLIFLISPDSARSPACLAEVSRAVEQKKRILPVVCRDYDGELPAALRSPQWTFLREGDDFVVGVQELIAAVNTDFDLMAEHRRLLASAETWQRNSRGRSFLLRKEGLRKAVEWLARTGEHPNKLPKPTSLQSEYILASQRAQTRGARIAFGVAACIMLALAVLAVVALAQRGLAKQNEQVALRNAGEAERQKKTAEKNADEAKRQAGIATEEAAEAERQRNEAERQKNEADKNAREAERQAGIAKTNEQTARAQQKLAEERRVEAERQRRLAEEKTLEERGARAAILGQRPGREFEALSVAVGAVGSSLKSRTGDMPPSAVVEGLDSALRAAKYSFPLRGHTGSITSAAFSPDGSRLLTVGESGEARLWDTADGRPVASWKVVEWIYHPPSVDTATTFSRDGRSLVTVGGDKTAVIRDVQTGEPRVTLKGHTDVVNSAAFSPDGTRVVTSSRSGDATARVWDAGTGEQLAATARSNPNGSPTGAVHVAAFSPDGARVVTTHQDGYARLWDARTGKLLKSLRSGGGNSAVFLPGGTRVLVGGLMWDTVTGESSPGVSLPVVFTPYTSGAVSPDGTKALTVSGHDLYLRDLAVKTNGDEGGVQPPVYFGVSTGRHSGDITFATFSPDGKRVVTASQDRTARVWDAASGETLMTLEGHADRLRVATFSPDGRYVVTAGTDGTARIWDTRLDNSLATLGSAADPVLGREQFAAVSPDGSSVVVGGAGNTALLCGLAEGRQCATLEGHSGKVVSAAFSRDGTRLLTVSDNQTILRDASTGRPLAAPSEGGGALFTPDGVRFITSNDQDELLVWSARDGRLVSRQKGARASAGFSPDGAVFYSTEDSGNSIYVYDARSLKYLRTLVSNGSYGDNFISFSPDGRLAVTSFSPEEPRALPDEAYRVAQVREVATGKLLLTLEGHTGRVTSAAFSPDGRLVVTTSADGTARVWDSSSGRQVSSLEGHTGVVVSAAFSPDSRHVVTAGRDDSDVRVDHTARLWDARSGKQLASLLGHTASVSSATFSPDGRYVVTASRDGTAKIYRALESDLLGDYLAGALKLLRFQREFEGVREFEPYLNARTASGGRPARQ